MLQRLRLAGEDRADTRLIERADALVDHIEPFDDALLEAKNRAVRMESAAAFILPRARHRRDAGGRVHVRGAVAAA